MKISLCYITKNEADKLPKSLAGAAAAADEIIVVDTGSADKTKKIAQDFGAKVYDYVWQDDFSGPRNFAIEQATGDYILFLDADEYISADTCGNLRMLLENNQAYDALLLKRYDINQNERDIQGEIFVLRAFRRRDDFRYQGRIHEELRADGQIIKNIAILPPELIKLYHTGYADDVNHAKAERNLHILQEEMRVTDDPGRLYMYLAEACRGLEDWAGMEHYARLDIAQGRRPVAFASRSYRMLLAHLARQGDIAQRRQLAETAVKDFPELPEFWAELAVCQAASYDYGAAVKSMENALGRNKDFPALSLEPKEFSSEMAAVAETKILEWQKLRQLGLRLKIATCLIAKNEAQEMGQWLAKAVLYSDEIIVVDTGSEDDTVKLAQAAGAKVCHFVWQDDFAAARNFALMQVDGNMDWIVFLDADEIFYEPQRVRGALAFLMLQQPDTEGVQVPIVNVDADAWGREIQRFRALRIWRNKDTFRYQGAIHEALYSVTGEIRQVYIEALPVRHTGYSTGRIQQKLNRNLQLIMKEMESKGEQPLHYRYLADCLYGLQEYELAAAYAQKALMAEIPTIAGDGELYRLWLHCVRKLKQAPEAQLKIIDMAYSHGLADMELTGWQGIICTEMGDYRQAKPLLEKFLQQAVSQDLSGGSNAVQGMLAEVYGAKAFCHARLGEKDAARAAWCQALQHNPYKDEILQQYYEAGGLSPQEFLAKVLPFFPDREQGMAYLTDWAVESGYGFILQELTGCLPENQQKLWRYFCQGETQQAGEQARLQAAVYAQELFAALLAIPPAKRQLQTVDCKGWASMLPAVWQRVIGRFYGWADKLDSVDWHGYIAGLTAMQGVAAESVYQEYARLALDFSWEKVIEVAVKLTEQQQWQAAYSLLAEVPEEVAQTAQNFWYHTGCCLYQMEELAAAQECFARAAQAGCRQPDLAAYQQWAAQREEKS